MLVGYNSSSVLKNTGIYVFNINHFNRYPYVGQQKYIVFFTDWTVD